MWVNEDGQSECPAIIAGIDVPNLRHPKGGLLPSGALSRESCPARDASWHNQIFNLEKWKICLVVCRSYTIWLEQTRPGLEQMHAHL